MKLYKFDNIVLILIILNALIIFLSGFALDSTLARVLLLLDLAITIVFLLELIVKIRLFGRGYFLSNWNKLDFILILMAIPSLFVFVFNLNFQDLSFLLVFRVMRVFKAFRFIRFVPGMEHLIAGVRRALRASIVVIGGFVVYIFIIGILSFYLFNSASVEYYSNPMQSIYTTFKLFTIEGWFEIPESITLNYSQVGSFFTYLYFVVVVLSGGIFGLSIVNSIFVDAMISDNNSVLEEKINRIESKVDQILTKQDRINGDV